MVMIRTAQWHVSQMSISPLSPVTVAGAALEFHQLPYEGLPSHSAPLISRSD